MTIDCAFLWIFSKHQNETYLMLQHRHDGKFGTAGGKAEPNETIIDALMREVKEEINYIVKTDVKYLNQYQALSQYIIHSYYTEVPYDDLLEIRKNYTLAPMSDEAFGISVLKLSDKIEKLLLDYPFAGSGKQELIDLLSIINK
jgi:8-oxo-dGTP pyrophosphatase MutT (NUDIX family)